MGFKCCCILFVRSRWIHPATTVTWCRKLIYPATTYQHFNRCSIANGGIYFTWVMYIFDINAICNVPRGLRLRTQSLLLPSVVRLDNSAPHHTCWGMMKLLLYCFSSATAMHLRRGLLWKSFSFLSHTRRALPHHKNSFSLLSNKTSAMCNPQRPNCKKKKSFTASFEVCCWSNV